MRGSTGVPLRLTAECGVRYRYVAGKGASWTATCALTGARKGWRAKSPYR